MDPKYSIGQLEPDVLGLLPCQGNHCFPKHAFGNVGVLVAGLMARVVKFGWNEY